MTVEDRLGQLEKQFAVMVNELRWIKFLLGAVLIMSLPNVAPLLVNLVPK